MMLWFQWFCCVHVVVVFMILLCLWFKVFLKTIIQPIISKQFSNFLPTFLPFFYLCYILSFLFIFCLKRATLSFSVFLTHITINTSLVTLLSSHQQLTSPSIKSFVNLQQSPPQNSGRIPFITPYSVFFCI